MGIVRGLFTCLKVPHKPTCYILGIGPDIIIIIIKIIPSPEGFFQFFFDNCKLLRLRSVRDGWMDKYGSFDAWY
jgi:hypothetical protein